MRACLQYPDVKEYQAHCFPENPILCRHYEYFLQMATGTFPLCLSDFSHVSSPFFCHPSDSSRLLHPLHSPKYSGVGKTGTKTTDLCPNRRKNHKTGTKTPNLWQNHSVVTTKPQGTEFCWSKNVGKIANGHKIAEFVSETQEKPQNGHKNVNFVAEMEREEATKRQS